MVPVVLAYALTQAAVAGGDAELFDPAMLIGRHGLAGELAAEPVILLGQDNAAAIAQGGQGRGDAAKATANHQDIGTIFGHLKLSFVGLGGASVSPATISQSSNTCSTTAGSASVRTSIAVACRPISSRGIA